MRLWTVHPKYLDAKGLTALWREALLAQKVLGGLTKGYRRHPQLVRFRETPDPLRAISSFLWGVHEEAKVRGYNFDAGKIQYPKDEGKIRASDGQLQYERRHLLEKLKQRDIVIYRKLKSVTHPEAHPLFEIEPGGVASWEVLPDSETTGQYAAETTQT